MYFVALVCPPPLNEKILRYKLWMRDQFGCVVAMKSPAHITLIPPFWLPDSEEEKLLDALQSFASTIGELTIPLNGFSHFRKRVLFVDVETSPELEQLKKQAEDHFVKIFPAIKKDTRPFHPHITIANRDMKPSHFEKAWEYFKLLKLDENLTTKTVMLLKLVNGKWSIQAEKDWILDK